MQHIPRQKIIIVITKSNFGGAQRYVYDLATSLRKAHEVIVLCGGEGLMKKRLIEAGVKTISMPFAQKNVNIFKDISLFLWLVRFIYTEKPSIVHSNSSKMGGITGAAVRVIRAVSFFGNKKGRSHITGVFTAHAWAFNENRKTISKILITFFHWLTVVLSDKTIAVSDSVKRQMSHTPFISKKITVIHLGIEDFTVLKPEIARSKLGIPQDTFSIGTIAELHHVKGLSYAISAIKELPFKCTYSIIGEGDLRESLEKQITSDPAIAEKVSLKGFVVDAASYISAFDVFLLPSLSEAFGYVLLEAGHAKVPVIATAVGGIPEIIEDMKSGILIHSKNSKEIARSLTFLYEHKAQRDAFIYGLSEKKIQEFSLEKMISQTIDIYTKK